MKLKIKEYRLAHRMTQATLAHKVGVSMNHIAMVERGSSNASHDLLTKIADVFEIDVANLLESTDIPPRVYAMAKRLEGLKGDDGDLPENLTEFLYLIDGFSDAQMQQLLTYARFVKSNVVKA